MAVLAIGLVGAGVGSIFGLTSLGWTIGTVIGQSFFGPKAEGTSSEGPRLGDLAVGSSAYGANIPIAYGTIRLPGLMIWSSGIKEKKVVTTEQQGGKGIMGGGGGGSHTQTTYEYSLDVMYMFAEKEAKDVFRIWADGKLIYDKTTINNGNLRVRMKGLKFRFYTGVSTQTPDGLIISDKSADVPAHRGYVCIMFDDLPLENFGNRPPNISAEFAFVTPEVIFTPPEAAKAVRIGILPTNLRVAYYIAGNNGLLAFHEEDNVTGDYRSSSYNAVTLQKRGLWPITSEGFIGNITPEVITQRSGPFPLTHTIADPRAFTSYQVALSSSLVDIWAVGDSSFVIFGPFTVGGFTPVVFHTLDGSVITSDTLNYYSFDLFGNAWEQTRPASIVYDGNKYIALTLSYNASGPDMYISVYTYSSTGSRLSVTRFNVNDLVDTMPENAGSIGNVELYILNIHNGDLIVRVYVGNGDTIPLTNLRLSLSDGILWHKSVPEVNSTEDILAFYNYVDAISFFYPYSIPFYMERLINPNVEIIPFVNSDYNLMWGNLTTGVIEQGNENLQDVLTDITLTKDGDDYQATLDPSEDNFMQYYYDIDTNSMTILVRTATNPYSGHYLIRILLDRAGRYDYEQTAGSLPAVIQDICRRVSIMPIDDLDTDELQGKIVPGYAISRQASARNILEQFVALYQFDIVESDYKLRCKLRGRTPVGEILRDDTALIDADTGDIIKESRTQEVELPAEIAISFMDRLNDYTVGTQRSKRSLEPIPTMRSQNQVTMEFPIAAQSSFIKQLTETMLFSTWLNRVSYELTTSWKWLALDPADVVSIKLSDGTEITGRLVKCDFGGDKQLQLEMLSEDLAVYDSDAEASAGEGLPEQFIAGNVPAVLFMLDVPLLRDIDDLARTRTQYYYAISVDSQDSWNGAVLVRSSDDVNYNNAGGSISATTYGVCITALPDTDTPFLTDTITELEVLIIAEPDRLSSVSKVQMLNDGVNAALIEKSNGEVEVIQFQTVEEIDDNRFLLSGIFRGRRGTDVFINGHQTGERFILLTDTEVDILQATLSSIDVNAFYRAVTYGILLEEADTVEFAPSGRDLMPWAPVHVEAAAVGDDIDITWVRRTRINGNIITSIAATDAPLNEDTEEYEVDILDGPNGTILRTINSLSDPEYLYEEADILTDFGSQPTELTLRVYQISAQVGRGFTREVTVNVE